MATIFGDKRGPKADRLSGSSGPDDIFGLDRNDTLRGLGGTDGILGGDGDDSVFGGAGDDIVSGGAGADTLFGEADKDLLSGGTESDSLSGGGGDDVLVGGESLRTGESDTLDGGSGFDELNGMGGADLLIGGAGPDLIIGAGGDDVIWGDLQVVGGGRVTAADADDDISGWWGADVIRGGAGADRIWGHTIVKLPDVDDDNAKDVLHGEGGNDVLAGGGGDDDLYGGADNDNLHGHYKRSLPTDILPADDRGDDLLDGGAGNDTLWGDLGDDGLIGGTGARDIADYSLIEGAVRIDLAITAPQGTFSAGTDQIVEVEYLRGTKFNDQLKGDAKRNKIFALGGADELEGRAGDDTLSGAAGNDTLNGGAANDSLLGGTGERDVASYVGATGGVNVSLAITGFQDTRGAGRDKLTGLEDLWGSAHRDFLTGDAKANKIDGRGGNDDIYSSLGRDSLTGGAGRDTFYLLEPAHSSVGQPDTITDFRRGQDKLNLEFIDANGAAPGFASFIFTFGDAAFRRGEPGFLRFASGSLYGEINGDGVADFRIIINGVTSFSPSDCEL